MKIDLHTHSEASKDGGITPDQYADMLKNELLDCVAITDHDRIDFALGMHKALGPENIIVGEEIGTTGGEIIGLFLTELVPGGMSPQDTIDAIKAQGGLVCIPHPFENVRKGISEELLFAIKDDVDIIEGYNGRAFFQNYGAQARDWAAKHNVAITASSDAHGVVGLGRTYTAVEKLPTAKNLVTLLQNAEYIYRKPKLRAVVQPKWNRFKKLMKGQN